MKRIKLLSVWIFVLTLGCQKTSMKDNKIDIQGHRGARGLMPENTIPAFMKALELGVNTLELDLAVTKDKELIISHEPYMGAHITLDSMGREISEANELSYNIYQMTYDEIRQYDVGSKYVERFPDQKKIKAHKPLLKELVDSVDAYLKERSLPPVYFNIEIKSLPEGDNLYHPEPEEYSRLVYDFVVEHMDKRYLNIQSFDFRILQYFHENYPEITLAALVENEFTIDENLDSLGFLPQIYSPYFRLLDQQKVAYLRSRNMKVIPWTVNEQSDIELVLAWGVDGIISDYPDRVIDAINN